MPGFLISQPDETTDTNITGFSFRYQKKLIAHPSCLVVSVSLCFDLWCRKAWISFLIESVEVSLESLINILHFHFLFCTKRTDDLENFLRSLLRSSFSPEIQVQDKVSDLCVGNIRFAHGVLFFWELWACRAVLSATAWSRPFLLWGIFFNQTSPSAVGSNKYPCDSFQMCWPLWTRVYEGGYCIEFGVSSRLAGLFPAVSDSQ